MSVEAFGRSRWPGTGTTGWLDGLVVAVSGRGGSASRGIRGDAPISPVRLGGGGEGVGLALPCAGTSKTKTSSTRLCARRSRHGQRYVVDARRSRGWVFRVVRGWGEPRVHHTTVFERGTGRGCARARECDVRVFAAVVIEFFEFFDHPFPHRRTSRPVGSTGARPGAQATRRLSWVRTVRARWLCSPSD